MDLRIRSEARSDHADVRALVTAAFGRPLEADLVDALRDAPGVQSWVAARAGEVVGHALFSPATVGARQASARAPRAVRPDHQGKGIGSALVRAGLAAARDAGHTACFVLGDPAYYARFGFRPAAPLRCVWDVPAGAFQVVALVPDGLVGMRGLVRYHPAFDAVG